MFNWYLLSLDHNNKNNTIHIISIILDFVYFFKSFLTQKIKFMINTN